MVNYPIGKNKFFEQQTMELSSNDNGTKIEQDFCNVLVGLVFAPGALKTFGTNDVLNTFVANKKY